MSVFEQACCYCHCSLPFWNWIPELKISDMDEWMQSDDDSDDSDSGDEENDKEGKEQKDKKKKTKKGM